MQLNVRFFFFKEVEELLWTWIQDSACLRVLNTVAAHILSNNGDS